MDKWLRLGAVVPKSPLIRFDAKREQAYDKEMGTWIAKGYLEKGLIDVVINLVVVPKKAPPGIEKWRTCGNF